MRAGWGFDGRCGAGLGAVFTATLVAGFAPPFFAGRGAGLAAGRVAVLDDLAVSGFFVEPTRGEPFWGALGLEGLRAGAFAAGRARGALPPGREARAGFFTPLPPFCAFFVAIATSPSRSSPPRYGAV